MWAAMAASAFSGLPLDSASRTAWCSAIAFSASVMPNSPEKPEALDLPAERCVGAEEELVVRLLGNQLMEALVGLEVVLVLGKGRTPRRGFEIGERLLQIGEAVRVQASTGKSGVDGLDRKAGFHEIRKVLPGEHRSNAVTLERHPADHASVLQACQCFADRGRGNVQLAGSSVNTDCGPWFQPAVHERGQQLLVDVVGQDLAANSPASRAPGLILGPTAGAGAVGRFLHVQIL